MALPLFAGDSSAQLQPKAALPPPTSKQQKAISNGNALQLVELWRASYVGWQLEAAGIFIREPYKAMFIEH